MTRLFTIIITINVLAITKVRPQIDPLTLPNSSAKDYRLPQDTIPVSYKIFLTPDLKDNFTFSGRSIIEIYVITKTDRVVLHAKNLTITDAGIDGPPGDKITVTPVLNTTNDLLVLDLSTELVPRTSYTLNLAFDGELHDDGEGFYRIEHDDGDGSKRWSAVTHFEPTEARRAFPCWDEPHLKATFDISIKHHKDLRALSNMPGTTLVDPAQPTHHLTRFETTPNMSTYLVALVITDYVPLSTGDGHITLWVKPGRRDSGKFVLQNAGMIMEHIENFTGIPYLDHGFKKMDVVPLFTSGPMAMENWGLITIDGSLLSDQETLSDIRLAFVLVHEFVHQWFGNLVTPADWKYIWLSEGFAYYLHHLMTNQIWPQWRFGDVLVVQCLQSLAFNDDSSGSSVSVHRNVYSPLEILEKLRGVLRTDYKALSLIRMIHHILGQQKFQQALQQYLIKMKFKAATANDMFEEFVKVFPRNVQLPAEPMDMFNNWFDTPGFAVINVDRDYEKNTITVIQERFLDEPHPSRNDTYYIPINFATDGTPNFENTTVTNWMDKNQKVTEIEGNFRKNEWVIFNKQQFGYYRVNYDERNWKMIAEFLQGESYKDVHVLNRAQIVDDVINLAFNVKLRWDLALYVLQFLKQETDPAPWYPALHGFTKIHQFLTETPLAKNMEDYIILITEAALTNLTFEESTEDFPFKREVRNMMVKLVCAVGSKTCRDTSLKMIEDGSKGPKMRRFSRHYRRSVMCAAISGADKATVLRLYDDYSDEDRRELFNALECSADEQIFKGHLFDAINNIQDASVRRKAFAVILDVQDSDVDSVIDMSLINANEVVEPAEHVDNSSGSSANDDVENTGSNEIAETRMNLNYTNRRLLEFEAYFRNTS